MCTTGADCEALNLSPPSNVCLNSLCSIGNYPPSSTANLGLIIGISVGGLVLVGGGIALAVFLIKRNKRAGSEAVYAQEAHNPLVVVVN